MPANRALDASQLQDAAVLVARLRSEREPTTAIVRALCEATGISPATAYRLQRRPDFLALVRDAVVATTVVAAPVRELVPGPVVERVDGPPVELASAALEAALPEGEADPAQERNGQASPNLQKTIVEAVEQPRSSRREVGGVPLWGDSYGQPVTEQDHAERNAYYASLSDRSQLDWIYYNAVMRGEQLLAETRAAHQEQCEAVAHKYHPTG
jgi:hypothetical protein